MNRYVSENNIPKYLAGYTIVELLVTMGIMLALFGIGTISLSNIQTKSTLSSTVNTFMSDFKDQQIRAMTGEAGSSVALAGDDYGIHFDTNSYTLFKGIYDASSSSNYVVNLPGNVEITSSFSSPEVKFQNGSGEVPGDCGNPLSCQITIKSTIDNSAKTLKVNIYGVISDVATTP